MLVDIGISMGYLYLMMGVIISSAVLPATLTLLWSGQNKAAVIVSPTLGKTLGHLSEDSLNITRSSLFYDCLAGDGKGSIWRVDS